MSDMSTLMWDIRRPHLPMVAFPGHKDSVTGLFLSPLPQLKLQMSFGVATILKVLFL